MLKTPTKEKTQIKKRSPYTNTERVNISVDRSLLQEARSRLQGQSFSRYVADLIKNDIDEDVRVEAYEKFIDSLSKEEPASEVKFDHTNPEEERAFYEFADVYEYKSSYTGEIVVLRR